VLRVLAVAIAIVGSILAWRSPVPTVQPAVLDELPAAYVAPRVVPRSIEELRAAIAAVLAREQLPGVGLALVDRERGPIYVGGVGEATGDTIFRVASITKSFVGLGIMRAVERGLLSLDQEVAPGVTLAMVLEHTAGWDDMRPNEVFTDDDALTTEAALAINPRSRVARWQPGTRGAYSNVGYTVAARALEVATGEPFDTWLAREVLAPLGIREAGFARTPALEARLAQGWDAPGVATRFRPIVHRPAGALLASPRDLAQLVHYFLRRGDGFPALVSPAGLDRIERTGTLPYPAVATNYGLGNGGDVSLPALSRGHDGGLPGFLSEYRYVPAHGIGWVILVPGTYAPRAVVQIRSLVFAYLTRDRAMATMATAPAATIDGYYRFASPRHALLDFVERALFGWRVRDRSVEPLLIGEPMTIIPTADGGFRRAHESGSSLRFTDDAMVSGLFYAERGSYAAARVKMWLLALVFALLRIAPSYLAVVIVLGVIRRGGVKGIGVALWPAGAALFMYATPLLFELAARRQELGEVTPLTVAICASTIGFALCAAGGVVAGVRRWGDAQIVSTITSFGALGLAIWLAANGIIGLRTWSW